MSHDQCADSEPCLLSEANYASFVLRCWFNPQGRIFIRLVDVRTGCPYLLPDVTALPDLITRLVTSACNRKPE